VTERVTLPPQGALEIFYSDQQHSNFLLSFDDEVGSCMKRCFSLWTVP